MKTKSGNLLLLAALLTLAHCMSKKIPAYTLPQDMEPLVKDEYTKLCDKGLILYGIHCGQCHTQNINRKQVIPDFNSAKLAGYEIRVANAQHNSHIEEDKLTTEELVLIVTFLNYKTKSGLKVRHDNTKLSFTK